VGDWLPEPLVSEGDEDPARRAEMADSLSLAFLVLLESLSPEQRAVLLLHDVFDYGYDEVADIVGVSESNARQLAVRARRHVEARRPRFESSAAQRSELARRFFAAARDGDVGALESLLADDVMLQGDGGGKAPALARAVQGRARVARTIVAWMRAGRRIPGARMEPVLVNGEPGLIGYDGEGRIANVMALEIGGGYIRGVRSIVNPDKLRHLGPVADLGALMKR
jgi:RNA polymerase sigma-70 factor (ECF subfamily)